jgi:hypothetical protein
VGFFFGLLVTPLSLTFPSVCRPEKRREIEDSNNSKKKNTKKNKHRKDRTVRQQSKRAMDLTHDRGLPAGEIVGRPK